MVSLFSTSIQSDWSRESRTSAGTATRCEHGGRKPTKWTLFQSAVLPVALPARPSNAPTMHFVQWEGHITQHSGCSTPRRKASYKAFNATFSSTPPPTALFLRPSVNKKLLSLTASQVCPLKAHTSLKLSAGPQTNALCTRETHIFPPRETFKCTFFFPPSARRAAAQNLSGQGGEAALEKVPLVLIRGDNMVRVRQRGADS